MSELMVFDSDIKSVEYEFTVQDIGKLERGKFEAKHVRVRGLLWNLFLTKSPSESKGEPGLAVYLSVVNSDVSKDWVIFAKASIKIFPSRFDQKPFERSIGKYVYSSRFKRWGEDSFMEWSKFIDPENGYINDNTCKFQVKIEAGPLQDTKKQDLLKFELIDEYCSADSIGKLRLEIKMLDELIDVCSPDFQLCGIPWSISVQKITKRAIKSSNAEVSFIQVQVYNHSEDKNQFTSLRATVKCKLISYDENIEQVEVKLEYQKFNGPTVWRTLNLIEWNEFIKPEKHFIQNTAFVIEIEMEIDEMISRGYLRPIKSEPDTRKRAHDGSNAVELECSICSISLVDQSLSLTKCGHMFCSGCIDRSLRRKAVCPSCNNKTTANNRPAKARRLRNFGHFNIVADIRTSANGHEHLFYNGYKFGKNIDRRKSTTGWRCTKGNKCNVWASTKVNDDGVIMLRPPIANHKHDPEEG